MPSLTGAQLTAAKAAKALTTKTNQPQLMTTPKQLMPVAMMPIYNPLRDRNWQAVMPRIRDVSRVSSVSSKK